MFERFRKDEAAGFELSIYLPHDYGKVRERYPVVYVQDDGNVVRSGFNYIDHLVMTKRLPKMIFVGVKPHNRNDDYTPWPARALLPGQPDFGGGAGHYLRALAEQIKPHVDAAYPTRPEPENTGIAGCSFGGLVSAYAYYRYPELFGKIAMISASFWYEGFLAFMRETTVPDGLHCIYMYVGELEGIYKQNIQREMVERTKEASALLLAKGFPQDRLKFETDADGTHDAFFFTQRFMNAMLWLFGHKEQDGAAGGEKGEKS